MTNAARPSTVKIETLLAAQQIEAALRAGEALLLADGVESPKLPEIVWALIREAAETLRRLPDRERSWLKACDRTGWPSVVQDQADAAEAFAVMVERVRIGEEPVEALMPRADRPTAQAIDRVWFVAEWRRFLVGRKRVRDWKIMWLLADRGMSVAKIGKLCRCSPRTVYNTKDAQCLAISRGLRDLIAEAHGR